MPSKSFRQNLSSWVQANWIFLIVLFGLITAANIFLFVFYSHERFVYFWDWSFYQSRFAFITSKLYEQRGLFRATRTLLHSIAYTEQSLLPPFVLAPLGYLFGTSRPVFLFSILNVFALPAALLTGIVFSRMTGWGEGKKWHRALIPAAIMLAMPQFWIPITLGFYDVCTLISVCVIWLILLSDINYKPILKALALGALLASLLFMRRWFGYWIISFLPALFFVWTWAKIKKQAPLTDLKFIIFAGLAFTAIFWIFAAPIGRHMLTTNYSDTFQAFKHGDSTLTVIWEAMIHYGMTSLAFAGVGFYWAVKNKSTRTISTLIGIQSLITLLMFARVQRIDQHHHYQFLIAVALFQAMFLWFLWQKTLTRGTKITITALFIILGFINFTLALVPQTAKFLNSFHIFAGAKHYPLTRGDTEEIKNIIKSLDRVTSQESKIYVAASSLTLNEDVLRNSCLYLNITTDHGVCGKILLSSHVDLRDGFPKQFTDADFVVVGDPVQFHLRPVDQRIVETLAQPFLNQNGIALSFKELPDSFTLDGGLRVRIFQRTKPINPEEIKKLIDKMLEYYPKREKLFSLPGK